MAYTSLEYEYLRNVRSRIEAATRQALHVMEENLKDKISEMAEQRVYGYQAAPYYMEQRRYSLERLDNMVAEYDGFADGERLTLRETTSLRGGGGAVEVDWVEQGIHQGGAGPRPYMDAALEAYLASGDPERQIKSALIDWGVD